MLKYIILNLLLLVGICAQARTLHVGTGHPYANPQLAAAAAQPGDTILIHAGNYSASYFMTNLQGTPEAWITIRGEVDAEPVFSGSSESMHFTDCTYLIIENLVITGQTGNGMNIDDGGTVATPSHHIILRDITFRDMAASGNNDLLKLSGLDTFRISNCTFLNGAAGGSGIDMVGCHAGIIELNTFTNMGSNAIQAKGGTAFIRILRNVFTDAGERAVNLGGSTGLAFFRPLNATYEAADMQVFCNLFIRGTTPIAYVGSTRIDVANNTIVHPERWVMRILQETVDTTRFIKCGYNLFRNNLVLTNGLTRPHVNIGPNADPTTFGFETNLWYDESVPASNTPILPSPEIGGVRGQDPRLVNTMSAPYDLHLMVGSPAIGAGAVVSDLDSDYFYRPYRNPPSIGAFEYIAPVSVQSNEAHLRLSVAPNPATDIVRIEGATDDIQITDIMGTLVLRYPQAAFAEGTARVNVAHLPSGMFFVSDGTRVVLLAITR